MIAERRADYIGYSTREVFVTGADPAVVMLHGFGDSADTWWPVLRHLAATGRAGIAVDLPGFGDAGPLACGPILPQLDAFVASLVSRHGARQPVVLIGNSLGGLLTVRAAAADRGLPIRGILAIGTAGTGWTRLLHFVSKGNLAVVSLLAKAPIPRLLYRRLTAFVARLVMYGRWRAGDPAYLRSFVHRLSTRPVMATALALLPEVNAVTEFAEVACPTTVLHGRRDRLVSVAAALRLHDMIHHSRLVVLPDSGHCPQLDAPERVVALANELATATFGDFSGTA